MLARLGWRMSLGVGQQFDLAEVQQLPRHVVPLLSIDVNVARARHSMIVRSMLDGIFVRSRWLRVEREGESVRGGSRVQRVIYSHNHLLATQERVADELAGAQSHGRVVVRHGEGRLSSGRWDCRRGETVVVMQSIGVEVERQPKFRQGPGSNPKNGFRRVREWGQPIWGECARDCC